MRLRKLDRNDFPLMEKWLANDHVAAFLGDADEWLEEMRDNFANARWISYYIGEQDDRPVGFIQHYETSSAPVGIWTQAPKFSLGIDFFIGEEQDLGKGYATAMVGVMKKKLRFEGLCKYVVADPDKSNRASVRVLEKNGFILQPSGLYLIEIDF
ncbi:MAG: acetyltransferase [Alistipes sp.]|nr:acetyltransferase [Alistipes sp.]